MAHAEHSQRNDNGQHGMFIRDEEVSVNIESLRAVKLPQLFWRDNPTRYFTVAEMTFVLQRIISDETKYKYVVIHLDADLLGLVGDIIDAPPAQGKYEAIKKRIIDSLSESQETRLRRLLRGQVMSKEKPSMFLQRLKNLASGQCNESVLRSLFMEQMPEYIRSILAISQLDDLTTLATQADHIAEVTRPQAMTDGGFGSGSVFHTTHIPAKAHTETAEKPVQESGVNKLCQAVEALMREVKRAFHVRGREKKREGRCSRSNTPHRDVRHDICYFHRKFGTDVRKFRQPCAWTQQQLQQQGN